jgi:predicted metal-dependent hydrolase
VPFIDIGTSKIEYSVVKGASSRYTYFRFRPDMVLEVALPRRGRASPEAAIKGKLPWIRREYRRMLETKKVLGRDSVLFNGSYLRVVREEGLGDRLVPDLARGELRVITNDGLRTKELIRRWFLKETSSYVVRRVGELAPILGVRPSRVDVREIGKWGYCTRSGRISFSWQLAALPEKLRDYVVLHELTHLVSFDHSPGFRRRLATHCPDFRQRETELDRILPYDKMSVI